MKQKPINLALQGGGAHGAFTWGILDKFLEDGRLDFSAISATSAGSMNAVMLADGLIENGIDGARQALQDFWQKVSEKGSAFDPLGQLLHEQKKLFPWMPQFKLPDNQFTHTELWSDFISPYRTNPLNLNPLRDIVESLVDFNRLRKKYTNKLFICATNVQMGEGRIFTNEEICLDVVMASAALPNTFQAVEIDGDYYWDGGYSGNPALWPLFYESAISDILIVHVNPVYRADLPKEAYEISNRVNELTFNSALIKELRAISFVQKLLHRDMLKDEYADRYKDVYLHAIRAEDLLGKYGAASKSNTDWDFLIGLRDSGRTAAEKWLAAHFKDVGKRETVDIMQEYLSPRKKLHASKHNPEKKS